MAGSMQTVTKDNTDSDCQPMLQERGNFRALMCYEQFIATTYIIEA
jgi:hypothetical protein